MLIPFLINGIEEFKTLVEKVTADVLEINRELELEAESEDMTDFCNLIIELE